MIIQAFLDATCRRRDKHSETLRDYQITALVQDICIYGDIQYKEVTKSVYQHKKNAYEGELSLVANEVKRKKKKSYAVQKKVRLVVMGVRGWKETAIYALSHFSLFHMAKTILS